MNIGFQKIEKKLLINKVLIKNFSYLSVLQIFNMLVPLFTYPYLIRVLGKEVYGLIIYAQVIVVYLQIAVNFGYHNLGTREISIHRDNKRKISEIFNSITISKSLFFFIAFFILWMVLLLLPEARNHKLLFILSMWLCLNDIILPVWFFQGMEKMEYITYLTLINRFIFIFLIFVLIKGPEDYLLVPIINGTGAIFSGIIAFFIIFKKEKISFYFPGFKILIKYFDASIDFFISDIAFQILGSANKFILGTFIGLSQLAYYDLAEKIVSVFRNVPLQIVRSTIYPRVAKIKNMSLVRKTTILMSIFSIVAIGFINIFAANIISVLGGEEMLSSIKILQLFSLIILTTHLSHYYLTVGMWSMGFVKTFRNIMIVSFMIFLLSYLILWIFDIINVYTITLVPIVVDIYFIIHMYLFWSIMKHQNILEKTISNY